MTLVSVAAVMALMLAVGLVVVALVQRPPRVTSIVLVVLDTVRADHCSATGYGKPTTPRLERLASEGLLFEHARSVAPWTLPSHASLFTGRLPHQHGCHWEHRWLADSNATMAETLAAAGFETMGVTTNPNASSLYHLDQGFRTFRETWRLREGRRGLSDSAIANSEIRELLAAHDRRKPFFLFVNYSDAHLPWSPPPPNDRLFGEASGRARQLAARGDLLQATLLREESVGPEDPAGLAALYDGEVRTADERLGELLDLLDQLELAQDTVVIVTSDHGEHLGEGGKVDHQLSLDEALLRVPLVVRWPRLVRPARVLEPVALTDLKGWIDELAEGRLPGWSPPPDLAPAAFCAQYWRPVDLVELVRARGGDAARLDLRLAAAFRPEREGGSKLLVTEPGLPAHFRVDREGREIPAEKSEAQAAELLRRFLNETLSIEPFSESELDLLPAPPVEERELKELRRLGYVGAAAVGAAGVHAFEHWSAGLRLMARGELEAAEAELERARQLAPEETGIEQALARVRAERERVGPK